MTVLEQINTLPRLTQWGNEYVLLADVRRVVREETKDANPGTVERRRGGKSPQPEPEQGTE
jgi:hypothetical protein